MSAIERLASDYDRQESMRYNRAKWTPELDALLEAKVPMIGATKFAETIGVKPKAVFDRCVVLGIRSRKTPLDCEAILEEYTRKTASQIARERGVSEDSIRRCIRRARRGKA
jgi:hypothetical protein